MAIRLNKVLTELNIGLQTAVDFLKNNKSLGEIKDDANLSTKISDEQYDALKSHFKGDKDMKNEAEKIFAKKAKDKKPEKNVVKTEGELEKRQQFTPLGKIDLSSIGKKPAQSAPVKEEPKAAAVSPVVEKKEEKPVQPKPEAPKAEAPKAEAQKVEAPKAEPVAETPKAEPVKVEPKPVEKKVEAPKETPRVEPAPKAEPVAETADEPKIYTLKSENKLAPKVNVLGKIDLDSLNQSTRPKKKSKEERKK
ncbi:MAG: translation initiation factor IF-2, partial [Prevotella sp.]|nr:translation initiation factor IF-2 [Prevotella sp.]